MTDGSIGWNLSSLVVIIVVPVKNITVARGVRNIGELILCWTLQFELILLTNLLISICKMGGSLYTNWAPNFTKFLDVVYRDHVTDFN